MKYLEFESLEKLNSAFSCVDLGESRIFARLEAYSCKSTNEEKRLKQHLEAKYEEDGSPVGTSFGAANSLSPAAALLSPRSPYGPLSQPTSRKTLFFLLSTLNSAFPDYDFSDIKPEAFLKLPNGDLVDVRVKNTLFGVAAHTQQSNHGVLSTALHTAMWKAIDEVIELHDCDIYEFHPEPECEPDAEEGCLWSFYFFFFNRRLKRVLFFTSRAVSFMAPVQPEEDPAMLDDSMMEDDAYATGGDRSLSYEQYTMQSMEV
ncbi:Maf1 regulator-domain-containing protein [Zopfochytrium polystomum]|nr:Maf1 regulator-domain-containing protein [Zopfochytrium polystomum]